MLCLGWGRPERRASFSPLAVAETSGRPVRTASNSSSKPALQFYSRPSRTKQVERCAAVKPWTTLGADRVAPANHTFCFGACFP